MIGRMIPVFVASAVALWGGCGGSESSGPDGQTPVPEPPGRLEFAIAPPIRHEAGDYGLPEDAFAAVVIRMGAVLAWAKEHEIRLFDQLAEASQEQLGIDLAHVRQVVVPFTADQEEPLALLFQSDEPLEASRIGGLQLPEGSRETVQYGGRTYFKGKGEICLALVDTSTVIYGPEPGVRKMLDAEDQASGLSKPLAEAGSEHMACFVANLAPPPAAIADMVARTPPPLKELVEGGKIRTVSAWIDLKPQGQIGLSVSAADADAAAQVQTFLEQSLAQLGGMLEADPNALVAALPPGFDSESAGVLQEMLAAVEVKTTGGRVDVTAAVPDDFVKVAHSFTRSIEHVRATAMQQVAKIQLHMFEACLRMYQLDTGTLPSTEEGLAALIQSPEGELAQKWDGPYLDFDQVPLDPWNHPFQYEQSEEGVFRIWSVGPDGQSGTEDDIMREDASGQDVGPGAGESALPPAEAEPGTSGGFGQPWELEGPDDLVAGDLLAAAPTQDWPKLVPIPLELPAPAFRGTPKPLDEPNVEEPLGKPRPPFLAPEGTVNLARGRRVTCSDLAPSTGEVHLVTDGNKEASDFACLELRPGTQWVQVDLGARATIYAIVVWHNHAEARVYRDVVVQVSDDPDFLEATTVFNNDYDNSSGLGIGRQLGYVETSEGKLIDCRGVEGRYVRLYSRGNHVDGKNHYTEVEVYGRT